MKLFVDTANLQAIKQALEGGVIRGVTTNPGILAKELKVNYLDHLSQIVALLARFQGVDRFYQKDGIHLSVEVFSRDPIEIIKQALDFWHSLSYRHLSIKVQIGLGELSAIRELARVYDFSVNCTCCMKAGQAVLAAAAGAKFVSLFWGRIRDGGGDPFREVELTRKLLDNSYPGVQIIVGSIRKEDDIIDAGEAGAHIVTVPPAFFEGLVSHPKTEEVIEDFFAKFRKWQS